MPFMLEIHRRGLSRLRELIEGDTIASEWRYPVVLIAMGHYDIAETMVRRQLQDITNPDSTFAREYLPFAERALEYIRQNSESWRAHGCQRHG